MEKISLIGSFVADTNNNSKNNFLSSNKFKILIPMDNITEDEGSFNVNVNANIKTQKVLFGDAPSNLQDHAVTVMASEDISGAVEVNYKKVYGKIKIIKISQNDNKYTNQKSGSTLEGAEFIIIDKNNKKIDKITTNEKGEAESKLLEKGEYNIKEINSPDYYLGNSQVYKAKIEKPDEIIQINVKNESVELKVDVKKHGPIEVKSEEIIEYSISNISNLSNVELDDFCLKDELPTDAIRISKLHTGTYNQDLKYKIKYITNLNTSETVYKENLNTSQKYDIDFDKNILNLRDDEYVTEIIFDFGTVKSGFSEKELPSIESVVISNLPNGYNFENTAIVSGKYLYKELEEKSKVKTVIYTPKEEHEIVLPKTGKTKNV